MLGASVDISPSYSRTVERDPDVLQLFIHPTLISRKQSSPGTPAKVGYHSYTPLESIDRPFIV